MPEEIDKKNQNLSNEMASDIEEASADQKNQNENRRDIFERINGKVVDTSSPNNSNPENPSVVIKSLRTFQGDVAEAMKNQNTSVLSVAMAEQHRQDKRAQVTSKKENAYIPPQSIVDRIMGAKKQDRTMLPQQKNPVDANKVTTPKPAQIDTPETVTSIETKDTAPKQIYPSYTSRVVFDKKSKDKLGPDFKKNVFAIIFSIILILAGIGTVIGLYLLQNKEVSVTEVPNNLQSLLTYNKQETVIVNNLNGEELIQKIDSLRRDQVIGNNEVLFISLEETLAESSKPITTQNLFAKLKTQIPPATLRSFDSAFMAGMYNTNGNQPFLIIRIASFENAYSGMLAWEKTLNEDLGSLFSARAVPITEFSTNENASSTNQTTTSGTTRVVNVDSGINMDFEDITIRNKDARVLKNSRGDTILLYSFLDQKTLLITSGEAPLREIINRLNSLKLIR